MRLRRAEGNEPMMPTDLARPMAAPGPTPNSRPATVGDGDRALGVIGIGARRTKRGHRDLLARARTDKDAK